MQPADGGRTAVLDELVGELLDKFPSGRAIIAIDGIDGAGKSMFADALAERLTIPPGGVIRASVDGFHRPRAERYCLGRSSPLGFYAHSYDYDRLRAKLIEPFRADSLPPFHLAVFDHKTDQNLPVSAVIAGPDTLLVLDGIFLHRPELRELWDFSIFLRVPFVSSFSRMAVRDGSDPNPDAPSNARYRRGQQLYFEESNPEKWATALIDNTDFDAPARVR